MSEICITSGINIELAKNSIADNCFMLDDVPDVGVICKTAQGKSVSDAGRSTYRR